MLEDGPVKALRPEEAWARGVISHTLSVSVEQHDDNSEDRMHDLWIRYGRKSPAAVEITAAADPESIKLWKLVNRGGRLVVEGLNGGWFVWLVPSSVGAKRRFEELPSFLAELEGAGERQVDVELEGATVGGWEARARDLGIAHASQNATDFPGSVYVSIHPLLERSAGFVGLTGDPIAAWVGTFLQNERPKVLVKLAGSHARERHAFVLVPGFTTAPFAVSELLMRPHPPLPLSEPQLPTEVTHVWVVGMWNDGAGCYWDPDTGWSPVLTPPATIRTKPSSGPNPVRDERGSSW